MLTLEQRFAANLVEKGHNLVIIGQAGTGKSFLINEIRHRLEKLGKKVALTASTGVASQQLSGGVVLHSWAGLRDGRYNNADLVRRLREDDDQTLANRIRSTDVLIIDEISMISEKIFEQLEYVCRNLRDLTSNFGNLQVVCVGDFFQLPPVPNDLYLDPGRHSFLSEVWRDCITHTVVLSKVVRQTEEELVTAVNELERGCPTETTNQFLEKLSRELGQRTPVEQTNIYLYSTNFDVDCHNSSELVSMAGEAYIYKAEDKGQTKLLRHSQGKRILHLKMSCPVILLRNLNKMLVNGSRGKVIKLEPDGPTVCFDNKIVLKLSRHSFSVYDPSKCQVIAERHQYPISLCFAMTIHKSQGLTLPHVVINCKNINQPGQLGVAVGRSVSTAGLQLLNYHPSACKKHRQEVYEFCEDVGVDALPDLTCCIKRPHKELSKTDKELYVAEFSDDSEFGDVELSLLDALETDKNEPTNIAVPVIEGQFQIKDAEEQLKKMITTTPLTAQQNAMNESIRTLSTTLEKVKNFMNINFQNISDMRSASVTIKSWTQFYQKYHSYLLSDIYQQSCVELFTPQPVNRLLAGTLTMDMRKSVVDRVQKEKDIPRQKPVTIMDSAQGKIRYVGGQVIAKKKYHNSNMVRRELESTGLILDRSPQIKVSLLQGLTVSQIDLLEKTQYPESILDTYRKQNLSCGLTNISDETFAFFLLLEKKRLPLYGQELLKVHGQNFLEFIHQSLEKDAELFRCWTRLFANVKTTNFCNDSSSNNIEDIVDDIMSGSICIKELFDQVLHSYLHVTDAEFRKKLLERLGKTKSMEHRKKVIATNKQVKGKRLPLTFQSISMDKTSRKLASHLKLKGHVLVDKKGLQEFTKQEIISLGECYDLKLKSSSKKESLADELASAILKADDMLYPEKLDQQAPSVSNEEAPKTTERRKRTQSKGKGKAKKKKTQVSELCELCGAVDEGTDITEPWISCTICDGWWHRVCAGITSDIEWEKLSEAGETWSCPNCLK